MTSVKSSLSFHRITNSATSAQWFKLGTLNIKNQGDTAIITIYGGEGQNSSPYQNLTLQIFIKKGYQSTGSTASYVGGSYWFINGANKSYTTSNIQVKLMCTEIGVIDVWVYFSWNYALGYYKAELIGTNISFSYSTTYQTDEPTTGVSQPVSARPLCITLLFSLMWHLYLQVEYIRM